MTLAEADLTGLGGLISSLVAEPARIREIEGKAFALGKPDAAARVADLLTPWLGLA